MTSSKLPKNVAQMVKKNNLVLAIKTLSEAEGISLEAAKSRIDAFEMDLKVKQQQKLASIASNQGIPSEAISFTNDPMPKSWPDDATDNKKPISPNAFDNLNAGLSSRLDNMGYNKPVVPHWVKRLVIILGVISVLFWVFWQVFD